ncbi:MAG: nucleotidyltransferase domain-containing protein [Pseudomonadota bacterium]
MDQARVLATLRGARAELEGLGLKRLWIVGSVAWDTAGPRSDVDLVAEFMEPGKEGVTFLRVVSYLEELLGAPVELMRTPIASPALRRVIEARSVEVF